MDDMKDFWSLNEGTFYCLYDKPRTLAFKKAIENTVSTGDVVLELGSGSGVLSMFAADAGARKVYAVELDKMNAQTLRKSIALNNYESVITVIEGDATTIEIPEKVDVVICEMIATGLIEELQIPAMNNALKFLNNEGKVILQHYDITVELVSEKNEFYNKKFYVVRYEFPDLIDLKSKIMSDTHILRKMDFREVISDSFINETFTLIVKEDGVVNGLRIGGNTTFSDGSMFANSISYSFPAVLPIDEMHVNEGEVFEVFISYSMCEGPEKLNYTVKKI